MVDGVGKDVEKVTNKNGGKQSKTLYAMHLIDPCFLMDYYPCNKVIDNIANFMLSNDKSYIMSAFLQIKNNTVYKSNSLFAISKVLKEGAKEYKPNNWRLIPQEDHINHALIHYLAYLSGDIQDDHLEHCMCRLMMAYATEKSENFEYTEYVEE